MFTVLDLIALWEAQMICHIVANGEYDETCHIIWLHDLNNVCEICGCTDALGVYVGVDNMLSVYLQDGNDWNSCFVGLADLPLTIVDEIYRQVMNYKK